MSQGIHVLQCGESHERVKFDSCYRMDLEHYLAWSVRDIATYNVHF